MKTSLAKLTYALIAIAMTGPVAHANVETLTCMPATQDGRAGILELNVMVPGGFSNLSKKGELAIGATARQIVIGGEVIRQMNFVGSAIDTAKGPSYELVRDFGTNPTLPKIMISVAAPAANESSTLSINGMTYTLDCQ